MRSLRWFLAAVPLAAATTAAGCNQISGVSDYEKAPQQIVAPCAVNADCAALGEGYICRKGVASYCVSLFSAECPTASGNYQSDEAFIFASILPTAQGPSPGPGVSLLNAMRLAISDFKDSAFGLPPLAEGRDRRQVAMLECNDEGNVETAVKAASHAVRDVGLPAVLGPMFSGITLKVATDITIPNGAFLLSPTAATQSLTLLEDFGLVWRAAPSADLQVKVLASFMKVLEADPAARAQFGVAPTEKIRVASVFKGDAFGRGLAEGLLAELSFNG
ncbi:MAG TPA: ABC transporter substrate-binding protein, partial [Polyangiaceae bacterium]|nr:ABC transporter substrate-binding protein [Polyangiaceae bacterium]